MVTGSQRILDADVRLSAAADVAAWGAASPALYQNCLGVLRNTLPPSAASWLLQHGFSGALTSAVAAGLRILRQLLDSSDGGDQTMQLAKDILQLITITNCWGESSFLPIEGAGHRAQALSADFASAAAAACGTLAQLLPKLTQQELATQQRYEQQAGRAARRHGRTNTDHYPPSARLLAFVRLSSELLRLWADLSVVFDEQPQPHQPQPVVAPSPAAAAAEGQAASQGNAATGAAGSAPTDPTNSSGSGSHSATTGSGGSGAAVFHEYIGHAAPLAAAVVHSWQLLQHSAAHNAAWAASEQMQQLGGPVARVKQVVVMRMAADMFQSFTKDSSSFVMDSSSRTAARAVLGQLSPQVPWLLMYCMAAFTAAMYESRQGVPPVDLPAAPSPSTTASASSRGSSTPSELQMPPYHAMLLDALWLPGPHPPALSYQRSLTNKMPQNGLLPVLYVLVEYLGGGAPVLPGLPSHGSASTSSGSRRSSGSSSPLQSITACAAACYGSLTAAPGTTPFWWGLSLQTLLLLPPLVAECVALEGNPWMLTIGILSLKSLHRGLQGLQALQQQQQQQSGPTALSGPAHQAGGCEGSWGDAAATPHMLEAAAQPIVPAAQRALAGAASDAQRDLARKDLQDAYGLITANLGPGTFLSQGSWQVPGPAVLAALEAAVRAASSPSSSPQATVCSLVRTVLNTLVANATAMRDAAACGLTGSHSQGPAGRPGLPVGVSCQHGPSQQQQHNSSGTATPSTDSSCSSQPQAGPQAAALVGCPGVARVTDAWAGLLASCLKATAASCCSSSDIAAGCMAQPSSSSAAGAQPAAGGSFPAAAPPGADQAAGFGSGAVSALLGAAYVASQWHPDAAAAAAPTAGAKGCSSSTATRRGGVGGSPGPAGSSEGDGSSSRDQGCSPNPSHQVNATDGPQLQPQLPPGWGFVIGKAIFHAGSLMAAPLPQPASAAPAGASAAAVEPAHELATGMPAAAVRVVLGLFAGTCEGVRSMVQHLAPADVLGWEQVQLLGAVNALSDAVTQAEVFLLGCAAGQGSIEQTLAAEAALGSQAGDASQQMLRASAWALLLGSPAAQQISQALQTLGAALCACLPSKTACNYPACTQLVKVSEAQLISGKGKRCSGCMLARYCCAEHQVLHWKAHKVACRALAAALPAAGSCSSSSSGQKKRVNNKQPAK